MRNKLLLKCLSNHEHIGVKDKNYIKKSNKSNNGLILVKVI